MTTMSRANSKNSKRLASQIAAAEKTLLALESLLAQTQEKITITRKLISELMAAQDGRPKTGTRRPRKR
jgi:hypothetical protein